MFKGFLKPFRLVAIITAALAGCLANSALAQSTSYDQFIEREMKQTHVQGLSIAVIRNGEISWSGGYGVTDFKSPALVDANTIFQAASIGKVSAAYATLILTETSALSLDQKLRDNRLYITEGCEAPTIEQALSHTTGMSNNFKAEIFTPDCNPGATFSYSGQGYAVLATMLEGATGKPGHEAIHNLVFGPLGMDDSRYGKPAGGVEAKGHISSLSHSIGKIITTHPLWLVGAIFLGMIILIITIVVISGKRAGFMGSVISSLVIAAMIAGAVIAELRVPSKAQIDIESEYIAASLTSHANDLALFAIELMRPTLISRESQKDMFAPRTDVADCIGWALGMGVDKCGSKTTYWQWGSNLGFQALFVIEPDSGDGVVILTNTGGGLDTVVPGRGGYVAARNITREILQIEGAWNLSGK